jgi:glycosyltransferase involved in cell wall biosynthesis
VNAPAGMPAKRAAPSVLVLSQHYWPESFRINEVAQSLLQAGCEICALTGQPNYPDGEIFPGYRALAWGEQRHPSGYTIYRVPLVPRGTSGARRLVLNYLSFIASGCLLAPWLLRHRRLDVVFVYGTSPILQGIVGMVLKRTHRAKLVTWVQDQWPQSLEATGYVRNRHALSAVRAVVRWIYKHNDLLLTQSPAFLTPVRALAGATPVEVHPNPGELAFEQAPPAQAMGDAGANALHLRADCFNVVFAGNLGQAQALDTILEAAERLREQTHIRFVLVGSGARSAWLTEQVVSRGLGQVELPGRFGPEQMPGLFAQASALLVTLVRGEAMSQTIPSKVQAYLAAGRPIVASLDGEGARVVQESRAGLCSPAEDGEALAHTVLRLSRLDTASRAEMGQAGRAYYAEHFQPQVLAQRLRARFLALIAA